MFKRIKSKIRGRDGSSDRSDGASSTAGVSEVTPEKFGLFLVSGDKQAHPPSSTDCSVDIIAIHGVNGAAYGTWTHSNGTFWLQDLLPDFIPGCRVYTYGYPSKVRSKSSLSLIEEYSRGLLSSIRDLQDDQPGETRPILFLCHSLGGIVCKQALVYAQAQDNLYGNLLRSVIGVVFLGCPHRGSDLADLVSIFAKILNAGSTITSAGLRPRAVRSDLIEFLGRDSETLRDLLSSARDILDRIAVVSFYETETTPPLSSLIVDAESSIVGVDGEEVTPLWENHKTICRFPGKTTSYLKVAKALRRIANERGRAQNFLKRTSTRSSEKTLDELGRTCVSHINGFDVADYKRLLPQPTAGTCQWICDDPMFMSWLDAKTCDFIWLTGHAGCGKTTLSLFLSHYLEGLRQPHTTQDILTYFCDDKTSGQKDAKAILIALIFQIVSRHRSLIKHVRSVFSLNATFTRSFSVLWNLFVTLAKDPKMGYLYVILDGLDECDASRDELLKQIAKFLTSDYGSSVQERRVKFLITSQPALRRSYVHLSSLSPCIFIDEGNAGYAKDVRSFIQTRVEEISVKHDYEVTVRQFLLTSMYSKADHTFLWVHMVLESVERNLGSSMKDFETILTSIPPDLQHTYRRYLSTISENHRNNAKRLLQLLLASSRPLHMDEINVAFTIRGAHDTLDEVARDSQTAMAHTIQGILGPLIRVSDSRVTLVHQSLKAYLLSDADTAGASDVLGDISITQSDLQMASACIWYLSLNDFGADIFASEASPTGSSYSIQSVVDDSDSGVFGELWDDSHSLHTHLLFREPDALYTEYCRHIASKYPFYKYASMHWADHLSQCEDVATEELREAAMSLLNVDNGVSRNWIQFYFSESGESIGEDMVQTDALVLAARLNLHRGLKDLLKSRELTQSVKDQALFFASKFGHDRIVAELLLEGANPNQQRTDRQTPLTVAAEHGHFACLVTLLKDKNTDINIHGRNGRGALSIASGNGHDRIVQVLLDDKDCGVNLVDHGGATPFLRAVGGGHISIILTISRHKGCDVNHQDKAGRTAMSWAAEQDAYDVMKKLLKLPGIDVNIKDKKGRSPLSWAAGNGSNNVLKLLLQSRRVDKKSVDVDKRNAFSWACASGHLNTLHILLKYGCPGIDLADIDGWVPLDWAIQTNAPDVVQRLLSTGLVNIERRDRGGRTALNWAVEYGHIAVVKALLDEGADPEAKCYFGRTPITRAKGLGRDDMLAELERSKQSSHST